MRGHPSSTCTALLRFISFFRLEFDLSSICSYLLGFFQGHCNIARVEGTSAGWVEAGVPKWPQGRWGRLPTGGGAGAASCKRLRDCWEGIPDEGSTETEAVRPKRTWHFQRLKGHLFCWSLRTKGWENGSWWSWNGSHGPDYEGSCVSSIRSFI